MAEERTSVVLEAPGRVAATLGELAAADPERPVAVVRELTKLHEEVWRGTLAQAAEEFATRQLRGEVVLVVGGAPAPGPAAEADVEAAVRAIVADDPGAGAAPGGRPRGGRARRAEATCVRGGAARAGRRPATRSGPVGSRLRAPVRYRRCRPTSSPRPSTTSTTRRTWARRTRRSTPTRWPLAPLARGRRLVHDRHGRARCEDRGGGRGQRGHAEGVDRPHVGPVPVRPGDGWTSPTTTSSAPPSRGTTPWSRSSSSGSTTTGSLSWRPTRGSIASRARTTTRRTSWWTATAPCTGDRSSRCRRTTTSSSSASSSSACWTTTTAIPTSCARRRSATRRWGSSEAGCAMSPSPGRPSPGACRCPGTAGTSSTSGTTRRSTT